MVSNGFQVRVYVVDEDSLKLFPQNTLIASLLENQNYDTVDGCKILG